MKNYILKESNSKKLGMYGYVLGMIPRKVGFLWVWVGYQVRYPIPTQKPITNWIPMYANVTHTLTKDLL